MNGASDSENETPPDTVDALLYARAATGDGASLDALLARYLPQLHAYVRIRLGAAVRAREASVDLVQSICRDLLAERGVFEFRGEERFRAWLFTSALNKIRDKHRFHLGELRDLRREGEGGEPIDPDAISAAAQLTTPSEGAIGSEVAHAIEAAMQALSDDHREVITLARVVGLPHRVIAEVMHRSEPAVRQLLGRALFELTRELRARGIEG